MTVLIDTARLPARERAEAAQAALHSTESPQQVTWADGRPGRFRTETVEIGPAVHMLRTTSDAVRIVRNARHVRQYAPNTFAIGYQTAGNARLSAGGVDDIESPAGSLMCVDSDSPYDYVQSSGLNRHESVIIAHDQIGLSATTIHAAATALPRSPVYGLVRGHLAHLFDAAEPLSPGVRGVTGQATLALIRALITSAAQTQGSAEDMQDSLGIRLSMYIDAHLTERDLSPERIAKAHNISLRHLYNVWAREGHPPITETIIERRLLHARGQLDSTSHSKASISTIARQTGFANSSHFSRRFRESFGVTPHQWRSVSRLA